MFEWHRHSCLCPSWMTATGRREASPYAPEMTFKLAFYKSASPSLSLPSRANHGAFLTARNVCI